MFEIENILLFLGLSWVLIVTPGPDLIYVLTKGIANGKRAGLISAVGVVLGILVHTVFAAVGLSAILQTSALAFTMIKFVGAGYLIYLGVKSLLGSKDWKISQGAPSSNRKLFTQGLLSNTLNPKVALFFIAFLPQFISTTSTVSVPIQLITLGLLFATCTLIFLSLLGYFSGAVGLYLNRKKKLASIIQYISGVVMVMLGVRLAFTRK